MTSTDTSAREPIDAVPFPRFSDAEMAARRAALERLMAEHELDHVVLYGAHRSGTAVQWLTRWLVTQEAYALVTPGERDVLLVRSYNHVPSATRMATEAAVRWVGADPIATAAAELERRGARGRRIGLIGGLGYAEHAALSRLAGAVVPLDAAYARLRMRKSDEELAWVRAGCALTDAAVAALRDDARVGMTEAELADVIERAYVAREGVSQVRYLTATPMDAPRRSVPAQWFERRPLRSGDAVVCELSAAFWGYPGQVLRTFAVAAEPTPLYAELHAVAEATFDAALAVLRDGATAAEVAAAGRLIDDAGFAIRDSLGHGFVPGLLAPSIFTPASARLTPEFTFEAGMLVVIQPNPVTRDERAGVQLGELVRITADGVERLHAAERGFLAIGG